MRMKKKRIMKMKVWEVLVSLAEVFSETEVYLVVEVVAVCLVTNQALKIKEESTSRAVPGTTTMTMITTTMVALVAASMATNLSLLVAGESMIVCSRRFKKKMKVAAIASVFSAALVKLMLSLTWLQMRPIHLLFSLHQA
jgi:hypothetical protein